MELLIGHLRLDVLILFFDIVHERVDWRLCGGLHLGKVELEVTTLNLKQFSFPKSLEVKSMLKPLQPELSQSSSSSIVKMAKLCSFLVSVVHSFTTVFSFSLGVMALIASM